MLSIFPSLLTYGLIGPLLIRLVLAVTCLWFGYQKISHARKIKVSDKNDKNKALIGIGHGTLDIILGVLLFIGLFTQVAALIAALVLAGHLVLKIKSGAFLTDGINYYLLLLIMAISLLFTGPGFLAFDLPL